MNPRISVIVPARNDAQALGRMLERPATRTALESAEVIVAACGDRAGTERAAGGRARVLWPPGSTRATLMNAGAAAARGEIFFFLHADSLPPPDALARIEQALADPNVVGGAFEHRFAEPVRSLRLISWVNRRRYRITRNYYGDQGLFVRAAVFRRLGGFRDLALCEDLDFSRRLKRLGRTAVIPVALPTSGRRFLARGPWRNLAFILWILFRYTLGLGIEHLAQRYHGPADAPPGSPWPDPGNTGGGLQPDSSPSQRRRKASSPS